MTGPRLTARVRASAVLLAALAAATLIPTGLARVGLPTATAIRQAITFRQLPAELAGQLAVVAAWIGYIYALAWTAADMVLRVRNRASLARTPRWITPLSTRAAALALVALGRISVPAAMAANLEPARPAVTLAAAAPPAARPVVRQQNGQSHQVMAGDNLWDLAEDFYGDGFAWRRIWAANPTTVADPRHLPVGAVLVIPPADHAVESDGYTVRPGDSLWSIAQDRLGGGADWPALWEANRNRVEPDGEPFHDPSLIRPGWQLTIPAETTPDPSTITTPATPAQPTPAPPPAADNTPSTVASAVASPTPPPLSTTSAPPTAAARQPSPAVTTGPTVPAAEPRLERPSARRDARNERGPIGALGAAGTLLAVGAGAALRRRRQRRQLRLPAHTQAPPPPPAFDELRADISLAADTDQVGRLGGALADLAAALAEQSSQARPRLIQLGPDRVEALLSMPVLPTRAPWRPEASGTVWTRDPNLDLNTGAPLVCPALISLGVPEQDSQVYLDLEAEGVVAVVGDRGLVDDVARSWILELATSPLSSGASVVIIGDRLGVDAAEDRARHVSSWHEVAGDAMAWQEQSAALLAANRWATPMTGRVQHRHLDDLAPLIVVADERPDDDRFERFCQQVADHPGTVTVVCVGFDAVTATRVEAADGEVRVPNLGLVCRAQAVSGATAAQLGDLLADAERVPNSLQLIAHATPSAPGWPPDSEAGYCDPPHLVRVRFLGEICVIGGSQPLTPKQTAVFAYIALHAPVTADAVEDAVWVAPTDTRHKRLANTVSDCRAALGAAHLPINTDGRYRAGPEVVTDLDLFERRVAYAATQDQRGAIATLRGALELVDGPVFTYRNTDRANYVWVDVENWYSTWELKVTDIAEDLAQRYLNCCDIDGAIWAAQRGLTVSKTNPRLTKLLIEAYLANGDTATADQVFASHQASLERLDLDDVDPELFDYYQTARRRVATS